MGAVWTFFAKVDREIRERRSLLYDPDHLRKTIQRYDRALDIVAIAGSPRYQVVVRVGNRGGPNPDGLMVPLFSVPRDISEHALLEEVRRRDLWRTHKKPREFEPEEQEREAERRLKDLTRRFMPGFEEYFADLVRFEDDLTIKQRCEEYRRELRRLGDAAFAPGTNEDYR